MTEPVYTLINEQLRRQQQPASNKWGLEALVTQQQAVHYKITKNMI